MSSVIHSLPCLARATPLCAPSSSGRPAFASGRVAALRAGSEHRTHECGRQLGASARGGNAACHAIAYPGELATPSADGNDGMASQQQVALMNAAAQSHLAYEMVQGALVRWCSADPHGQQPPTAVLVHGILGSRRNMVSFAKRIVEVMPSWQVLLVDLRCHGESAAVLPGPHSVEASASDVLRLLGSLKLFPAALIGHSFGGKVVMSMAEQFGRVGRTLPKPVQVWVLDSLPGAVRAGGGLSGSDHPAALIDTLRSLPVPLADKRAVITAVSAAGFSMDIARWVATNLVPCTATGGLRWGFDLEGIAQLYRSYEETQLWPLLETPQKGLNINFVKAEHSNFRWGGDDEARIAAHGHRVHLLCNSGHWVHTDNPEGLLRILTPSFLHMEAH